MRQLLQISLLYLYCHKESYRIQIGFLCSNAQNECISYKSIVFMKCRSKDELHSSNLRHECLFQNEREARKVCEGEEGTITKQALKRPWSGPSLSSHALHMLWSWVLGLPYAQILPQIYISSLVKQSVNADKLQTVLGTHVNPKGISLHHIHSKDGKWIVG